MDGNLRSVAIMIKVTSRHRKCTHFNLDYSRMPAVTLQVPLQNFLSVLAMFSKIPHFSKIAGNIILCNLN